MATVREVLQEDSGVRQMARLYASLNDWYMNIHQARRGVRACERVCQVRDRGLVPLAQRYFEFVASQEGRAFMGDAEELLQDWEETYRPDYVEESEEHPWSEWERSLRRVHLDPECRIATFAIDTSISVNNHTINAYDIDRIDDALESEFEALWAEWWHRLDDLYWERRFRLDTQIVQQMEKGILESEDKSWERKRAQYPEFPYGTIIGGEKIR